MGRSWEYTDRSQTHEFGNWDLGRAIPFRGKHKFKFLCSVSAKDVQYRTDDDLFCKRRAPWRSHARNHLRLCHIGKVHLANLRERSALLLYDFQFQRKCCFSNFFQSTLKMANSKKRRFVLMRNVL